MKINDERLTCFGYGFFFAITSLLGAKYPLLKCTLLLVSFSFVFFGVFSPARLNKVNKILNFVFSRVQYAFSNIFLFVIYFFVFTPMAVLIRASGRDLIGREIDLRNTSYWLKHNDERTKKQYFKDPF